MATEKTEEPAKQSQRRLYEEDTTGSQIVIPWSHAMTKASDKVGSLVARTANGMEDESETVSEQERLRTEYLEQSLSSACRLLLNVNYSGALVLNEKPDVGSDKSLILNVGPMNANLERQLRSLNPRSLPVSTGTEPKIQKLYRADAMRSSAAKELQEALKSYEMELAATNVAKNIIRS